LGVQLTDVNGNADISNSFGSDVVGLLWVQNDGDSTDAPRTGNVTFYWVPAFGGAIQILADATIPINTNPTALGQWNQVGAVGGGQAGLAETIWPLNEANLGVRRGETSVAYGQMYALVAMNDGCPGPVPWWMNTGMYNINVTPNVAFARMAPQSNPQMLRLAFGASVPGEAAACTIEVHDLYAESTQPRAWRKLRKVNSLGLGLMPLAAERPVHGVVERLAGCPPLENVVKVGRDPVQGLLQIEVPSDDDEAHCAVELRYMAGRTCLRRLAVIVRNAPEARIVRWFDSYAPQVQ